MTNSSERFKFSINQEVDNNFDWMNRFLKNINAYAKTENTVVLKFFEVN